jgi:hypothetical protein
LSSVSRILIRGIGKSAVAIGPPSFCQPGMIPSGARYVPPVQSILSGPFLKLFANVSVLH